MQNSQPNPQQTRQSQRRQPFDHLAALGLPSTQPTMTYALLAIIVVVFVAQMVTNQLYYPREPLLEFGAIDFRRILYAGEYYRLFTGMFLHVNQIHIFFNGVALWSFGKWVERFFGHTRFGIIYLLGGLAGSIASFILTRGLAVGASAAIFAIIGADMVFLYQNRQLLGQDAQRELRSLIILAVINFGIGIYTQFAPGAVIIDNWAHIGGFVAGIILAWFMSPRYQLQTDFARPSGYRIEDGNPFTRSWMAPAVFSVALLLTLIFAAGTLTPYR